MEFVLDTFLTLFNPQTFIRSEIGPSRFEKAKKQEETKKEQKQ